MARGWDSKSVESQIESAGTRKPEDNQPRRSPAEVETVRQWEGLMLSRTRVLHEMETCQNPRYRVILDKALADLDVKLTKCGLRRSAHSA